MKIFNHFLSMSNKKESGGGFDKTTDFKWFGIGLLVFVLIVSFELAFPRSGVSDRELVRNQVDSSCNTDRFHLGEDSIEK